MDIKDTYTRVFLQAAELDTSAENIKKYKSIWWWNFREKSSGGLRLTQEALKFIEDQAKIKTYKIEFPKEFSFTPQVIVWLDKFLDSPFFIDKRFIIVMREIAAFELYLFSGDVRKFGHNKALSKRLSQEFTSSKS
jgi:hypothetical protein